MDARMTIAGLLDRAQKAEAEASNREAKVRELEGVIAMLHAENAECAARCRAMTAVVDAAREHAVTNFPNPHIEGEGWLRGLTLIANFAESPQFPTIGLGRMPGTMLHAERSGLDPAATALTERVAKAEAVCVAAASVASENALLRAVVEAAEKFVDARVLERGEAEMVLVAALNALEYG